jgi:hypothetical protein
MGRYTSSDPTARAALSREFDESRLPRWQRDQIRQLEERDRRKSGLTVRTVHGLPRATGLQSDLMGNAFSEMTEHWPREGFRMLTKEEAVDCDQYPLFSTPEVPLGSMPGEAEMCRTDVGRVSPEDLDDRGVPSRGTAKAEVQAAEAVRRKVAEHHGWKRKQGPAMRICPTLRKALAGHVEAPYAWMVLCDPTVPCVACNREFPGLIQLRKEGLR